MKKLSVGVVGALGLLLLALPDSSASAANTPVAPAPTQVHPGAPGPMMQLAEFKLVSVARTSPTADGQFQLDVAVENIAAGPKKLGVEVHGPGMPLSNLQVTTLASHSTQHFLFVDPSGGPETCGLGGQKEYTLSIGDMVAAPVAHTAVVHAQGCSFQTLVRNPWDSLTPDHVANLKNGTLYVQDVKVLTGQTCNANAKLKIGVVNHTPATQTGFKIGVNEGAASPGMSTPVAVVAGQYAEVDLTLAGRIHSSAQVMLVGGTKVEQSMIQVQVVPSCQWFTDLDPKASPAPAIPR